MAPHLCLLSSPAIRPEADVDGGTEDINWTLAQAEEGHSWTPGAKLASETEESRGLGGLKSGGRGVMWEGGRAKVGPLADAMRRRRYECHGRLMPELYNTPNYPLESLPPSLRHRLATLPSLCNRLGKLCHRQHAQPAPAPVQRPGRTMKIWLCCGVYWEVHSPFGRPERREAGEQQLFAVPREGENSKMQYAPPKVSHR